MDSEAAFIEPLPEKKGSSPWLMLAIILGAGLIPIALMVALLLPAIGAARSAARRGGCVSNLKQIGMALQAYHDEYDSLPPAIVYDAQDKPMHSWRVLILPYLYDHQADLVHKSYRFDEPWDSEHNQSLAILMPTVYQCSADETAGEQETSYVAVVGPETVWPTNGVARFVDVADGLSKTIAVIETTGAGVPWMEPKDIAYDDFANHALAPTPSGLASQHPTGANVLLLDGSVHFVPESMPKETIIKLLTKGGGEDVELP